MALKKGSKEAKEYMAKLRAARVSGSQTALSFDTKKKKPATKKPAIKKVVKQTGSSNLLYDKKRQALPVGKRLSANGNTYYEKRADHSDKGKLLGIGNVFDTSVIKEVDDLKKQYHKLAKKYHPDMGGTTIQFQQLQKDYESLLKKLLNGSKLNNEQVNNEIVIDKAIRDIIDTLIHYNDLIIEVIGKWLWISGNTYAIKDILKSSGLTFIKKANVPYWVYKGSESSGRGKMSLDDIKMKYGSTKVDLKPAKTISGFRLTTTEKARLKSAFSKLKTGLNKRPI